MAAKNKIPPNLEPFVLEKAAEGLTTRKIAALLKSEHGLKIGHDAVARMVSRTRKERAVVAKEVARERLSTEVVSDLDGLERLRQSVAGKAARLAREPDPLIYSDPQWMNAYAKLKTIERQIRVDKLRLAGADEPSLTLTMKGEPTPQDAARIVAKYFRKPGALTEDPDGGGKPEG